MLALLALLLIVLTTGAIAHEHRINQRLVRSRNLARLLAIYGHHYTPTRTYYLTHAPVAQAPSLVSRMWASRHTPPMVLGSVRGVPELTHTHGVLL